MTDPDHSRTVIVTGAGGGMAAGINARLARAGHRVVCVDLDVAAARRAAGVIASAGGPPAWAFGADVTSADEVAALALAIETEVGPVDALVNAAGVLDRRSLGDQDAASFRTTLDVNLVGPFQTIRAFLPGMVARGWGRVVNISSIAAVTGYPYPGYAASKAGLSNLTRSLVLELWGTGVTANAICPGVVDTPMIVDAVRAEVAKKVPTTSIVAPEEIGALCGFLLSDDARNITGAELVIDGGATSYFRLIDA